MKEIERKQIEICKRFNTAYEPLDLDSKLGVSANFFSGEFPLNGLRHPAQADTCSWYLWAGEILSEAEDFFRPLHVRHLVEKRSEVVKYLALPAGWRFLVAGRLRRRLVRCNSARCMTDINSGLSWYALTLERRF
jgi:hypothetical protein